jgi:hypothetical protein
MNAFRRAVFFLLLAACATTQRPSLGPLYTEYQKAIEAGDAAAAERYVSAGRLRNLSAMSAEDALASMNVLSPKEELAVVSEMAAGDEATLIVRATVAGNVSTGRVSFVHERGAWKIFSETWDIGTPPEEAPPPQATHNDAMRRLMERGYARPSADYLVMAAGTGDLEAVKLFVAAGYSVNTKSGGAPPIVNAASSGRAEVVLYLIQAGADVNAVDDVNCTALMRAADKCAMTAAIRALLHAGAKTDVRAAGGANALELAGYAHCDENAALIRAAAP